MMKQIIFAIFYVGIINMPINAQEKYLFQEQLAQSTTRIIVVKKDKTYVGTGFFYQFRKDSIFRNFIVTNKHVTENSDKTILSFNKKIDGKPAYGNTVNYQILNTDIKWINHPDPSIDLSIMDLNLIELDAWKKGCPIFIRTIPNSFIPNDSIWETFTYLEDLIMIGYPNGILDEQNNLPIFRTGISASQPKLNVNHKPEFITDISTFGGSSGSPIFIRRRDFELNSNKPGTISWNNKDYYYFVGIHYKSEYYNQEIAKIESQYLDELEPTHKNILKFPLNIGYAIKSSELNKFNDIIFNK